MIHIIQSILPIKTDTSLRHGQSGPVPKVSILGLFPSVRTGWPDHCSTSQFENKIDFFQEFLPKSHLLLAYCSGLIWLESFYQKRNYHCDENGLPGQFGQLESARSESWLYFLMSTLCAIHQCPCTIVPWTSRTVTKISSFWVHAFSGWGGGEVSNWTARLDFWFYFPVVSYESSGGSFY